MAETLPCQDQDLHCEKVIAIKDGNAFAIQPSDIVIPDGSSSYDPFLGIFGKAEVEATAKYAIFLAQRRGGWLPLEQIDVETLCLELEAPSHEVSWVNYLLKGSGWFERINGEYYFTDIFVLRCYRASPRKPWH